MDEKKFIKLKKEEYGIKGYIKRALGKGKISKLEIEYTPVGEKLIVSTSKPGLVIGRKGEKIEELTRILKTRLKLENPHIEIDEIKNPLFDAPLVADEIAMALERMGNLRFKVIAYRKLQEIMSAGALGCELRLTGKLPSERARSWRFAEGYLKKAGESRKEVDRAKSVALTKTGIIGVKVAIMSPDARIYDKIDIDDALKARINISEEPIEEASKKIIKKKKITKTIKKMIDSKNKEEGNEKSAEILKIGETKVIEEFPKLNPEEDGTAIKIEEEIEEGIPQEDIDSELKKDIEEHGERIKENKGEKE